MKYWERASAFGLITMLLGGVLALISFYENIEFLVYTGLAVTGIGLFIQNTAYAKIRDVEKEGDSVSK